MRFRKILVPSDFSQASLHALHYAIDFAKRFNTQLHLLHVTEDLPVLSYVDYEGFDLSGFAARLREDAEGEFERLLRETPDLGDLQTQTAIQSGVPYMAIINEAKEEDCDLIILATHGRSGLGHFLMGSVAEKVVRNSPCPVLTVKMPEFQFEPA